MSDGTWTLDTMFNVEWKALDRAKILVIQNNHNAVRVTSESDDQGARLKVIFEKKCGDGAAKRLSISRVDDTPLCFEITDYFKFESRKTIGRLLREFLDERQITALELLFDFSHLVSLERHETLIHQAIQRIAALQAKKTEQNPLDIADTLYHTFEKIKKKSKSSNQYDQCIGAAKNYGVQALNDLLNPNSRSDKKDIAAYGAIANLIGQAADFDKKLQCMIDLLNAEPSNKLLTIIDEVIAEILDNSIAMMDILNHEPEAGKVCTALIQLSMGNAKILKNSHPCLSPLNGAMAGNKLPLTQGLLRERVQAHVRSIKPLAQRGGEYNREIFVEIVRALKERTGFAGGPGMSEAVTLRAKITLKHSEDDLSMSESIESVLGLVADPAIRLGYLLDLYRANSDPKFQSIVFEHLTKAEKKLISISTLVPDPGNPRQAFDVLSGILKRLQHSDYPPPLHTDLTTKIDKYLRILETSIATGTAIVCEEPADEVEDNMTNDETARGKNTFSAGTRIFEEGDDADCAYLLKSGTVEISTVKDGTKITLITLGPNQIFGELALLGGAPRSASATAVSDCTLTIVTKHSLESQIEDLNGFMKYWLLYLGDRIRDLTERVEK